MRKNEHTIELLGCSINQLKAYLENKFQLGMTWDNYGRGGWAVDHIRPCSSFDLTVESERRKCFHYTNLQPLWERENNVKNDKWNGTLGRFYRQNNTVGMPSYVSGNSK